MKPIVLFDFDDTLVDTYNSRLPAIIEYCWQYHGAHLSENDVSRVWGQPFVQMMQVLSGSREISVERYLSVAEKFPLVPFPDAESTLLELSNRFTLGIVTALASPILYNCLESLGWSKGLFSLLCGSDANPYHKPDPRVFDVAITMLEISAERRKHVTYVGDALSDAQAATGADFQFVGVARDEDRAHNFSVGGFKFVRYLSELNVLLRAPALEP
jgi:phosphoglycolate phosphatase-like HAD superfamily hydrolase